LNITATPAGIFRSTFFITEYGERYMCVAYPPQRCGGLLTSA